MKVELRLIGTGTPTPSKRRKGSCYLVQIEDRTVLFDVGPGSFGRLIELGVNPCHVSDVFLTHFHFDHFLDYPTLVLTRWDQGGGRIADLRAFGPPPLADVNRLLFTPEGVFGADLLARTNSPGSLARYVERGGKLPRRLPNVDTREIKSGDVVDCGGFTVTAAPAVHAEPYLTSLAYRLDVGSTSIVYTGDTAPSENIVELARGCDVLIHLCAFLSGSAMARRHTLSASGHLEAAEAAARAGARTLVLTHLSDAADEQDVRRRLIDETAEVFGGRIVIAEDLLSVPLKI